MFDTVGQVHVSMEKRNLIFIPPHAFQQYFQIIFDVK